MTSTVKVGVFSVITIALVALAYYGKQTLSDWGRKISVRFASIGKPAFNMGRLAVPVNLVVENKTPISVAVDNLKIRLLKNNILFGETSDSGPFTVNAGSTPLTLFPTIDVNKIWPTGNLIQQITSVISNQTPAIDFKALITITVQDIAIDVEQVHKLYATDLLNAK